MLSVIVVSDKKEKDFAFLLRVSTTINPRNNICDLNLFNFMFFYPKDLLTKSSTVISPSWFFITFSIFFSATFLVNPKASKADNDSSLIVL